jgi:predicted ATPase
VEPAEAPVIVKAIDYLRKAGKQAIQANANPEAVGFLTQALGLVERLPMSADRLKLELGCLIELAPALIATRGYADATLERNFARARFICEQLGLVPQLFPVLNGLNFYYMVRVNFPVATELADRLQSVARQLDDPLLLRPAANALVATRFFAGKMKEAVGFLDMVAGDIPLEQERALATQFGHNPTQAALVIGGTGLWVLGYPDRALATSERGVRIAREIGHAHSQAYASQFHTNILGFNGDLKASEAQAAETVAISKRFGFPVWAANGAIGHGWAIALQGRAAEGIPEIQQGIAVYQKLGIDLGVPFYLGHLADVYLALGQRELGLDTVERALAMSRLTGELWIEAELCRLKGELLLLEPQADTIGAKAAFEEALKIAQAQEARSWELRAMMSSSRLLQREGKYAEARAGLEAIYNRFSEGWETQDLKHARAMLDELAQVERA